ncbi:5'-deoxynucleotidase HDDC2 isoform X2 [Populus alba x Populus x berolinensis]|nr:5'-deoxynucleotidase HDDC2 isoform X2 [Populus alba x Populus x berolinensis]
MTVNAPTHCTLPPIRTLPTRSSFSFFKRRLPISLNEAPNPRIVLVRCDKLNSDGLGPMRSVLETESLSGNSSASSAIDFLTLCHRLKTTKRKGWINQGIKGPESIADHMYRMSLMALIVGDLPGVNRERCIKIAIVHDIAEAEEIKELWAEYENNASLEANIVKDFDKVEMILQALEYEMEHGKVLDEFFLSTAGKFQTEIGKSWAAEIASRRKSTLAKKQN